MLGCPGSRHIFLTLTTASSGAQSLASAPKVPLHMEDLCLCSVSSMKNLPCAFKAVRGHSQSGQQRQQRLAAITGLPVMLAHWVIAYLPVTMSAKDSILPVEHGPPSGK